MTQAERRAVEAVDEAALLRLLADLVAIPSVANAETPAQERMATELESIGLETDVWPIDFASLKKHPAYAADVERHEGLGVVGTTPGGSRGPTLILNGHIDVVPAGEGNRWTRSPYKLTQEDGRLFGRGTVDMKGAVCCAVAAARALRDATIRLDGALQIQSVIGEEDGGAGTLACLERGHTGQGAIVLEPTESVVAPAQAGALSFRITVPGLAAHGAFREEGIDPLEKFIPVFQRLRSLETARNHAVADPLFADQALPYALTIGRIHAGIWPSTVAESLVAEGRYGVAPDESIPEAKAAFEDAIGEAAAADAWLRDRPPVIEWRGAQFAAARTPDDAAIVTTIVEAVRAVTGDMPAIRGVRFGADMRLLVNQGGIPTVLYGPGDVRDAHRPDETVLLEDLLAVTRVLVVTAMRFCGVRS
jgi:acetylornithine deacetylase